MSFKCKECKYYKSPNGNYKNQKKFCCYHIITGKLRACNIDNCDKFAAKKSKKEKEYLLIPKSNLLLIKKMTISDLSKELNVSYEKIKNKMQNPLTTEIGEYYLIEE